MNFSLIPRLLLFIYLYIFISTEALSLFGLITREIILPLDLLFVSSLIFINQTQLLRFIKSLNLKSTLTFFLLVLLSMTFIQGFFSAPGTTDSMVYHLPRIMYWIQEKTLAQSVIRNSHDFMAPFAEYLTLHLYFLTGNDRLVFLSQWFSYIAVIALTVIISKQSIKLNIKSIYIALLAATMPIIVLQSSSTQIDLVTTVMVLLSVYYAVSFKESPGLRNALGLGLALGFGVLTKATFVIYAIIPLGIILVSLLENQKNLPKIILLLFFAAFLALLLQLRFLSQNLTLYGNLSGQPILEEGSGYTNEEISLPVLTSNLIRNSFINLPVPLLNGIINQYIYSFHDLIKQNPNDPKSTYNGTTFQVNPVIYPQEDIASSPIHFLLIIIAGIYLALNIKRLKQFNKNLVYIFSLSIASFIIFSTLLKWQPFHPRLLIPFLLLGSLSSFLILNSSQKLKPYLFGALTVSMVLSFILCFLNVSKPYISYNIFYNYVNQFSRPNASVPQSFFTKPREEQYFNSRYYWYGPYKEAVNMLQSKAVKEVTLNLMDEFEYPLWILIQNSNLNLKVVSYSKASDKTIIITTSKNRVEKSGLTTKCIKTEIDYGYICLSKKNSPLPN